MYGVTRKDKGRNEQSRGTMRHNEAHAYQIITERISNWQEHVTRRDEEHTLRKVFRTDIRGKVREDDRK